MTEISTHWNKSAAKSYIEARQDPDGAFTDPGLTSDVILALSGRGLGSIRNLDCGKYEGDLENHGKHIKKPQSTRNRTKKNTKT